MRKHLFLVAFRTKFKPGLTSEKLVVSCQVILCDCCGVDPLIDPASESVRLDSALLGSSRHNCNEGRLRWCMEMDGTADWTAVFITNECAPPAGQARGRRWCRQPSAFSSILLSPTNSSLLRVHSLLYIAGKPTKSLLFKRVEVN